VSIRLACEWSGSSGALLALPGVPGEARRDACGRHSWRSGEHTGSRRVWYGRWAGGPRAHRVHAGARWGPRAARGNLESSTSHPSERPRLDSAGFGEDASKERRSLPADVGYGPQEQLAVCVGGSSDDCRISASRRRNGGSAPSAKLAGWNPLNRAKICCCANIAMNPYSDERHHRDTSWHGSALNPSRAITCRLVKKSAARCQDSRVYSHVLGRVATGRRNWSRPTFEAG